LNPVMKVGSQLSKPLRLHTELSRAGVTRRSRELLEMVRLRPNVADLFPHQLSGGMRQRVMIAMALSCDPSVVIADEPTTALDVVRQDEILAEIEALQSTLGFALVLVTHDMAIVAETCERLVVMYAGTVVEAGLTAEILARPSHPYTRGLVCSSPGLVSGSRLTAIAGRPPDLTRPPTGCLFHPRCPFAEDICETNPPSMRALAAGTESRCHFSEAVLASPIEGSRA
jgi:oligopeptide/dipeptide ABC transporter ATP-binding protein